MKILQLSKYYPPTYGGLEIVAEFFSRAAIDLGHSVQVLSVGKNENYYRGKYGEEVWQSSEDIKVKSSPISFGFLKQFNSLLKNHTPDVVLVHLPNPFSHEVLKIFRSTIKEKNIRIVGVFHSDIINQVTLRDAYNLYFKSSIEVYDNFICSSPNLIETSPVLSSIERNKVKVIPFCIDNPEMVTVNRPEHFTGKFLTIGRMVPYKGFEFLIDTFKKLPYELSIIGDGPLKESLVAQAPANVKFLGSISENEKFQLFSRHDALIVSSINRAEAFGMTIVEAFSVGLPVLASNIDTGVSYLVREGVTGLKFEIKNKDELIKQIERLSHSPELSKKLSRQSMEFFKSHLSYEAFRNNFNQFLNSSK